MKLTLKRSRLAPPPRTQGARDQGRRREEDGRRDRGQQGRSCGGRERAYCRCEGGRVERQDSCEQGEGRGEGVDENVEERSDSGSREGSWHLSSLVAPLEWTNLVQQILRRRQTSAERWTCLANSNTSLPFRSSPATLKRPPRTPSASPRPARPPRPIWAPSRSSHPNSSASRVPQLHPRLTLSSNELSAVPGSSRTIVGRFVSLYCVRKTLLGSFHLRPTSVLSPEARGEERRTLGDCRRR